MVADKRSTSIDDCVACSDSSNVPNEAQTACVNPNTLKGLGGVPTTMSKTEGGTIDYNVKMNEEIPTISAFTVTVSVTSNNPRCKIATAGANFVRSAANWNTEHTIKIMTNDDGVFLAKDAISYTCLVTHKLTSSDTAESYNPRTLTLDITSIGCGKGEFIGPSPELRGLDSTKCICKEGFFLPPLSDCVQCPTKESECTEIGLDAPIVKPEYWRSDPTSPNLTVVPFYSCPFPNTCVGGNASTGRCSTGHDDTSPVCAVCSPEHVLQGEQCLPCPGYTDDTGAIGPLAAVIAVAGLIYMLVVAYYLSRPALSKNTKTQVRRRLTLSSSQLSAAVGAGNDDTLDRQSFANIVQNGTGNDGK